MSGGTLFVGQSGGATAVINATLAGVVTAARQEGAFDRVLGLRHGASGLLDEQFIDLTGLDAASLEVLAATPSSALGTSRRKLSSDDIQRATQVIRERVGGGLVLIGGNDSADSALRLHEAFRQRGDAIGVVLAPKTVDNDLPETDHCPGYGTAARCFATAVRDATWDSMAAPELYPVKFIDVMGRNAGWLAASAGLAFTREEREFAPLILLPERPVSSAGEILEIVRERVRALGFAICVVPETLRDASGRHLSGDLPDYVDPFGHPYQMPPAVSLAIETRKQLGLNARFERPGSTIRMGMALVSDVDRREARELGVAAVRAIGSGQSGCMMTLERIPGEVYSVRIGQVALEQVANRERTLENRFIDVTGHGTTAEFREYALPLLGSDPFPPYFRLRDGQQ